jgi:hypothetical protein
MTKREAVESWLEWLKRSISETIDNQIEDLEKNEVNIDWLVHYLDESIDYDLGKFLRGLQREVRGREVRGCV